MIVLINLFIYDEKNSSVDISLDLNSYVQYVRESIAECAEE
jgi:predicted RNA-binding protein Jag